MLYEERVMCPNARVEQNRNTQRSVLGRAREGEGGPPPTRQVCHALGSL